LLYEGSTVHNASDQFVSCVYSFFADFAFHPSPHRQKSNLYAPNSNSCIFTPIENWTRVYMNLFTRNSPYYHILKYLLFLLKHPVYIVINIKNMVINIKKFGDMFQFTEPSSGQIWKYTTGTFRKCAHHVIQWLLSKFLVSQTSSINLKNNINSQLDVTITNFIDNFNQLNMFRAIISPILRSIRLRLQRVV